MRDSIGQPYFKYWGKAGVNDSYHLLVYHCLDVAAVASELLNADTLLLRRLVSLTGIPAPKLLPFITFLVSIHDIGKFSFTFQHYRPDIANTFLCPEPCGQRVAHHSTFGSALWEHFGWCNETFQRLVADSTADPADLRDQWRLLLNAVTGHHGRPPKVDYRLQRADVNVNHAEAFVDDMGKLLLAESTIEGFALDEAVLAKASFLLAGLTILADWLGSNENMFTYEPKPQPLNIYWQKAQVLARLALVSAGVLPQPTAQVTGFAALYSEYTPRPMQYIVDKMPCGKSQSLTIIEDLTGGGKTEAATVLTSRLMSGGLADGIYMALPTTATANAMHKRIKKVYPQLFGEHAEPNFILVHSAAALVRILDESDKREAEAPYCTDQNEESIGSQLTPWLRDGRKRALLAQVGVGTIDQALLGVLPAKHSPLRLLGLFRKVLIVDEVHAYDTYTHRLLCDLLGFHAAFGGSAILLSATLPLKTRQELLDAYDRGRGIEPAKLLKNVYPVVVHRDGEGVQEIGIDSSAADRREICIESIDDEAEVLQRIIEAAHRGRCAAWICNTVSDAIRCFDTLEERLGNDARVLLFHSRFTLDDRQRIEGLVVEAVGKESTATNRRGVVVVGTQVIEQSLDIDFDVLVTDLAPVDLIIQRLGRLHRHQRNATGDLVEGADQRGPTVLTVHAPEWSETPSSTWFVQKFPAASMVYVDHGKLWLGLKILRELGTLVLPDHARKLMEYVYGPDALAPEGLQGSSLEAEGRQRSERTLASSNTLSLATGYDGDNWWDEVRTPTRLGEDTTTIRLGVYRDGQLQPISKKALVPWAFSEVRLSARKVDFNNNKTGSASLYGEDVQAALTEATARMTDEAKWCVVVPMLAEGPAWVGKVLDSNGTVRALHYDSDRGLRVEG